MIRAKLKPFLMAVLFVVFVFCNKNEVFAQDKVDYDSEAYLVDEDGELIARYYRLSSGGYIIIDDVSDQFIEYSLDSDRLNLQRGGVYRYSELDSEHEKHSNSSALVCDSVDYDKSLPQKESVVGDIFNELLSGDIIEQGNLWNETRLYSYNPDGRCGAVAASILIRYYYDYVDRSYINNRNLIHGYSNGEQIVSFFNDNYVNGGSDYYKLWRGIKNYLRDVGLNTNVFYTQGSTGDSNVYSRIKSCTNSGIPTIVGLAAHPTYGYHWTVSTGYKTVKMKYFGIKNIVVVNDGWGNSNINVNMNYVDGCMFLR